MRLFIGTEFNGFGGKLVSMALVPEDADIPEFYCEIEMNDQLDPWVKENVVPHMKLAPVSYGEFQNQLSAYLQMLGTKAGWPHPGRIDIIADWPDDIRYFCEAMITAPGERINMPNHIRITLDHGIEYTSEVPHNALSDARAIMESYQ